MRPRPSNGPSTAGPRNVTRNLLQILQRAFSSKLFLRKSMYGTGDPKQHQMRLLRPLEYCEVKGDGWILPALHKHGGEDFWPSFLIQLSTVRDEGRTASELERALEAWMRPASEAGGHGRPVEAAGALRGLPRAAS